MATIVKRKKETYQDRIFDIINTTVILIFFLTILYPLIYILSASFSSGYAVITGKVWLWPVDFSLEGYSTIFKHKLIVSGFRNALIYMISGTCINIVVTILAAYPLSRRDFFGRNFFMFLFVFTMLFNGGLIPSYLLIKNLGMVNTRWVMIVPNALAVWNVIITRTYFQTSIPGELLEAAQLDGCSDFYFLYRIVIPLSTPIIAVITLFYAVGHWNSFFQAFIYLNDPSLFPLQLVLRDILIENQLSSEMISLDPEVLAQKEYLRDLLKYSLIVVASVPVLILYPFIQRYFVKGVMIGSLKG